MSDHDRGTDTAVGRSAAVLAPTPRLTVTIEHLHDRDDIHLHAGGQGIWQARMLATLGLTVRVCGHFAGEAGAVAHTLVGAGGIEVIGLAGGGTSGAYVHDRRSGERVEIGSMAATSIDRHELDDLYGRFLVEALAADVVLLGGPDGPDVVPPDLYRRLAADLGGNDKIVVADLTGPPQAAVLAGGVTVLKVSDEELGLGSASTDEIVIAALDLARRGAEQVLVTRPEEPTVAVVGDRVLTVRSPRLEPVDPRGAGDSFTAAYAAHVAQEHPPKDALRHAAAAGALNVTRHGLASGEPDRIAALARQLEVQELDVAAGRAS